MDKEALEAQIKREKAELEAAPKIPVAQLQPKGSGNAGRCHWCGTMSDNLVTCEVVGGVERWKGIECCGGRHA